MKQSKHPLKPARLFIPVFHLNEDIRGRIQAAQLDAGEKWLARHFKCPRRQSSTRQEPGFTWGADCRGKYCPGNGRRAWFDVVKQIESTIFFIMADKLYRPTDPPSLAIRAKALAADEKAGLLSAVRPGPGRPPGIGRDRQDGLPSGLARNVAAALLQGGIPVSPGTSGFEIMCDIVTAFFPAVDTVRLENALRRSPLPR